MYHKHADVNALTLHGDTPFDLSRHKSAAESNETDLLKLEQHKQRRQKNQKLIKQFGGLSELRMSAKEKKQKLAELQQQIQK